MLSIHSFTQGPVDTNAYLIGDNQTNQAVVIDPAWDGRAITLEALRQNWKIQAIWLTHAHFDHIAGASAIVNEVRPEPPLALHPADYPLYTIKGGAMLFGMDIDNGPTPSIQLTHGQQLKVGSIQFEVRCTPGHTPGHVVFYCPTADTLFCGDVIFQGSIGRTDLPGGNYATLIRSIEEQVLTLPDRTMLYSGHGPQTTVGIERVSNPFLL